MLYHLLQAFCEAGDEVVYAWRSFEAYPIAVAVTGATSVQVPLTADARHDLDAMAAAVTDRTKVVIVCSPNNPTGPSVRRAELEAFLDRVPSHVVVVLDEAYREFVRDEDPLRRRRGLPARGPTWWRCAPSPRPTGWPASGSATSWPRSGSRPRCARAPCRSGSPRSRRPPRWPRSSGRPTCSTGCEALAAERDRVVAALTGQGWAVPDAQGNFVWLPLGERTADFAAAAEQAGIVVRPFAGEGVRVTIGEPAGNDVFLEVAAAFAG